VKSKRITLRLSIAFATLLAILVGVGQLGLYRMKQINETVNRIAGEQLTKLELAQKALAISNNNSRIMMETILVEDRALVDNLLVVRSDNSKELSRLLDEIESRCVSPREKQLLSAVKETRKPYVESYLRATQFLVDENKHKEAEAIVVQETLPALIKYHAAWTEFADCQKHQATVAVEQTQVDYLRVHHLTVLLIVLAVVFAFAIAQFVTRETAGDVERDLQRNEERMRVAMEAAKIGFWDLDVTKDEHVWSNTCKALLGVRSDSAANFQVFMNAIHPGDRKMVRAEVDRAIREKGGYVTEFRVVWPDESVHWRRSSGHAFYNDTGHVTRMSGITMDIDERKYADERLHLQAAALEAAANAIVITDSHGAILWANPAFTTMTGYSKEEVLGKNPRMLKSGNQPESYYANLWSTISSGKVWRGEIVNRRKDGTTYTEEMTITPVTQSGGNAETKFVAIKQDISQRKAAEERVQFLAYYDALTELPNRTLLRDQLAKAVAGARRRKDKVALLFLDLDRFKDVNDSLGHSVGDLLLQEVAERLKRFGREPDAIARLGGDEFLVVLNGVKEVSDAAIAADRLVKLMTAGFVIQGHPITVSCSVGISVFPEHGVDGETLIKNADTAMYSAKEKGRNNFQFFTEDMNAQAVERLTLESSLRLALDRKELFLVYQPQMDIASGRIVGLEALLRWQHPELGLVPPDKFIRIAENSGLILPIGEWVLRTACSQARTWQDEGLPALSVAVNVSAIQVRQEGFCKLIRRVLHETKLAPQYLELELTESLLLANADLMLSVVQELKAMGVTLAIDDFGTGYSSFSYLRQFQVSKLKIDRVFVRDVAVNSDDAAITTAIISMAKSLHLKVIAEGVENEAQMSFLRGHQCDEIQGYYFSKPLAFDKVADKLRSNGAETQAEQKPTGDNCGNKPYEVGISLMSIGLALLVSADPVTVQQFSLALRELSISPDACRDAASAALLLKRRKFDAVIVDLQLGSQSGLILDEVRLSPSNRTAVTFGIDDNDAAGTAAFRRKSQFVFERPLSAQSIHKTLKPAYGLILRERRRYFRCLVSIPVIIRKQNGQAIRCNSINISGGGMALSTRVPLPPGECVRVQFTLPDQQAPLLAESTICWSKTGHLGVRFESISDEHKSELQVWLSQKLEQILPEFVADQFRNPERAK
jgi:diguanylate cyclase (GGDEF)-like protein/PAS domain S-box-containing protein